MKKDRAIVFWAPVSLVETLDRMAGACGGNRSGYIRWLILNDHSQGIRPNGRVDLAKAEHGELVTN